MDHLHIIYDPTLSLGTISYNGFSVLLACVNPNLFHVGSCLRVHAAHICHHIYIFSKEKIKQSPNLINYIQGIFLPVERFQHSSTSNHSSISAPLVPPAMAVPRGIRITTINSSSTIKDKLIREGNMRPLKR